MKADISIVQSKKGTEIMVSGNKINKYGILAAILFTVPILLLFRWIHGEDMAHVSLLIFWSCALAGFGVNLLLHALFFGIFSPKGFRSISFVKHKGGIRFCHCNEPIRMWQYRTTCFLPILLLGILPLLYGMATGNYYFTLFGTFLLIGSMDDICILWKLRSFSKDAFINDCSQELPIPYMVRSGSYRKIKSKLTETAFFTLHLYPALMCQHHLLYIVQT